VIRALAAALLVALPAAALAQTLPPPAPTPTPTAAPDLCSTGLSAVVSRPTQTTAACVVKPSHVLIESGYQTQTLDAGSGSYTFSSLPNATIRIGTPLQNVEFDVIPPSYLRAAGFGATSDTGAGIRWQIGSTAAFAYSLNAIATAPTGTNPAANPNGLGSANAGTYTYNGNIQGTLGPVFGYGATLSIVDLNAGTTRYASVLPSLDVTASLPASFGVAVEAYRQSNGEGPATPAHVWFDGALTKDAGNAQFDLNYGLSNRIVPMPRAPGVQRRYAGFGVSYLF
jgi:hypothetical protein